MRKAVALLALGALVLALALPVIASGFTVQVSDSFNFSDGGIKIVSHFVQISEPTTNCFVNGISVFCNPLTLFESLTYNFNPLGTITTVTQTITNWITSYVTVCPTGGCNLQSPDTAFDATLTGLIIPAITLAMYLSVAFALKVRSFPIVVLFGAVAVMSMAGYNVVPSWTVLFIVVVLSAATAQILGKIIPMNSLYATMMFLLLLGSFMQIYASSAITVVPGQASASSNLPCIGNIFGYCIVSDIINGLLSALSITSTALGVNTPWGTALVLGLIFLGIGAIAGIFGFGSLMNVVFSVGLSVSIWFYVNAELSLFTGIPVFMYLLLNAIVGVADLYMMREAFSGVGGGGGGGGGGSAATAPKGTPAK